MSTKKSNKIQNYFTLTKKKKEVDLDELIFINPMNSPLRNKLLYSMIKYFQKEVKRILISGKDDVSFWFNLRIIIDDFYRGNLRLAMDSKNNVYGLIMGDYKFSHSNSITILMILPPYRGKGVGKYMVESWHRMQINEAKECFDGLISLESLPESKAFWIKMGYKEVRPGSLDMVKKIC